MFKFSHLEEAVRKIKVCARRADNCFIQNVKNLIHPVLVFWVKLIVLLGKMCMRVK